MRIRHLVHSLALVAALPFAAAAQRAPKPAADTATLYVYSPDVDPTSPAFDTEPQPSGAAETMVTAINRTLRDEMAANPSVVARDTGLPSFG